MTLVFLVCKLSPFGTQTLSVMDMSHQYVSFLSSLRDILTGKADLLYLPSMGLGDNMMGLVAYYLTSPLNLITCLFPKEALLQAVSVLFLIRTGLCGLTMCIYSGERNGYSWRCLFSAFAYAFMAYMIAYCFNYLWQDCVILLPLVALGISKITEGRGHWLYLLSLAGALYLNFYIGYILCIFSVLFFLYELFSSPLSQREHTGRTILTFLVSSIVSAALACIVLLPAFFSLSGGKAQFSLSVLTLTTNFDPVSLLSKLYLGAFDYEEIMPAGMPHIFCGTMTTALAVLYFADRHISRRRRILTGCFFLIMALSFWISALDLIWHCLNVPNWYNYRYAFLFSFLLAATADQELHHFREGTRPWHLLLPIGIVIVASLLVFIGRTYSYVTWQAAIEAVVVTAFTCGAIWLLMRPETGKRMVCVLAVAFLVVHVAELAVNAGLSLADLTATSTDSAAYGEYVSAKSEALDLIDTGDTFTRVESTSMYDMDRCEAMLFGYDGISHYSSTISLKNLDFLDRLGLDRYTDLWALYGTGTTSGVDSLLGVRYIVSDSDLSYKGYTIYGATDAYTIWEDPDALPIAWTADGAIAEDIPDMDSYSYTGALYAAAAPEVDSALYTAATVTSIELEGYEAQDGQYMKVSDGLAYVTYTLTINADGPLYGEVDIVDFPAVFVSVDGTFTSYYATTQTNGSIYLGEHAAGDTVVITLQSAVDLTIERAAFATEDLEALATFHAALSEGGCELTKLSSSHYTGAFTTGEGDSLLVLTIPYDTSWTILLDGEPIEAIEIQDCLMAVPVTAGSHTIELRYMPAGLIPGVIITVVTGAGCIVVGVISRKRKKT